MTVVAQANTDLGEVRSAAGTGFFVDEYGKILTAHHLVKRLGRVVEGTLAIGVLTQGACKPQPVTPDVEYDQVHDVLFAKIRERPDGQPYPYLRYRPNARGAVRLTETRVYTWGFPEGYNGMADQGVVKAFEGPDHYEYLWVTNMEFKDGQSGSPVYLEDGSVIGIVKGNESNFQKNSFIIPVSTVLSKYPNWLHAVELAPVGGSFRAFPRSCCNLAAGPAGVPTGPRGEFDTARVLGPSFGVRLTRQSTGPRSLESRQP